MVTSPVCRSRFLLGSFGLIPALKQGGVSRMENDVTWPQPACLPSAQEAWLGGGAVLNTNTDEPFSWVRSLPQMHFPRAYFSSVVFLTSFLENKILQMQPQACASLQEALSEVFWAGGVQTPSSFFPWCWKRTESRRATAFFLRTQDQHWIDK